MLNSILLAVAVSVNPCIQFSENAEALMEMRQAEVSEAALLNLAAEHDPRMIELTLKFYEEPVVPEGQKASSIKEAGEYAYDLCVKRGYTAEYQ